MGPRSQSKSEKVERDFFIPEKFQKRWADSAQLQIWLRIRNLPTVVPYPILIVGQQAEEHCANERPGFVCNAIRHYLLQIDVPEAVLELRSFSSGRLRYRD